MRGPLRARVVNETRSTTLALDAVIASSWWRRAMGLMGVRALKPASGLIIDPCTSIHTWFMAFAIDVVFVAKDGRVVKAVSAVPPWRFGPIALAARYVVELPAGVLSRTGTVEGDRIAVYPAPVAAPGAKHT